ncbi:hypothetical protein ACP70R_004161 [Stipagrostis hirtigluma subsp. patula]
MASCNCSDCRAKGDRWHPQQQGTISSTSLAGAAKPVDASSMQDISSHNPRAMLGATSKGENQLSNITLHEMIAADDGTATTTSSSGAPEIDSRLLEAAIAGDARTLKHLALHDPGVLLGTTPYENTCLHISAIHGHHGFSRDAVALEPSLLAATNDDGETPLLAAVTSGHVSLASVLLRCCRDRRLCGAVLTQDWRGCNALHHAIRGGRRELALELIAVDPSLSRAVNGYGESPMFLAVMRDFADVFEALLMIPDSAHGGARGYNALHAAVRNGNSVIAGRIMETRPRMAREEDFNKNTPMHMVVLWDMIDVLRVLLKHDRTLGYAVATDGTTLLNFCAHQGHVGVARELLQHCPDAPYCTTSGWTCLHEAVNRGHTEFVEFILESQQLRKLINMQDCNGETALHFAVDKCNPKMVTALLLHQEIDVTVLNNLSNPPSWVLHDAAEDAKNLNWNEVCMLMLKADPKSAPDISNLHKQMKDRVTFKSRKDIRSLTQTYTSNTSLVAILIATITFAAAFTLPGGYSSNPGSEGLPIMAQKVAFQAFLISDTLAMCSSLVVAFVCIIARWEDLEFLLYYRSFTKKLMWFAYIATIMAFATGLYTVLAPQLLWLAVGICVLSVLLPVLTKLLGEWPVMKLKFRLGRTFKSELLDMV